MNDSTIDNNWYEANQRYLSAAIAVVVAHLKLYTERNQGKSEVTDQENLVQQAIEAAAAMPAPSPLERLCKTFSLSHFERDVLLLCAGMEMSTEIVNLLKIAQGEPRAYPTFSIALAALPDGHWDALAPTGSLRRWQLIEVGSGYALTISPLRIDEAILHYLTGTPYFDERLVGFLESLQVGEDLVPTHQMLAEKIAGVWYAPFLGTVSPLVQLTGTESAVKRAIAAATCAMLNLNLSVIYARSLPSVLSELDAVTKRWTRHSILSGSALLLDCDEVDVSEPGRMSAIGHFCERVNGVAIVACRERMHLRQRQVVSFDVQKPTSQEQGAIWQQSLAKVAPELNGQVKTLVNQFNLNPNNIRAVCVEAAGQVRRKENDIGKILWNACRVQARPRLDELAQRIEAAAQWEDLVLPQVQTEILHEVLAHVRQRGTVYEDWGFSAKSKRGLGISALFAGASGTGKTLAAEVLANQLRLDLYRIDLSSVVSKYIGETEKNLRQVFDAAEEGGAILLFDEADALFGKRSEVKDARDRYANIEVSYLLQRMECYPGLAILTTNLKSAIDTAFLRRIRFVVQFPFPDAVQRAEIWQRVFPDSTPCEGLDAVKLARLNVAGGNIRNIALNAAFLAADAGEAVQMKHLLRAAQTEYAKLEKPLTEVEIGNWT